MTQSRHLSFRSEAEESAVANLRIAFCSEGKYRDLSTPLHSGRDNVSDYQLSVTVPPNNYSAP
jgi:hypothetical protein